MSAHDTLRPSSVLAAYAETLFDGRRVVILGDSSSGLAAEFMDRGARLVHVYDPDASRVAEAAARNPSRSIFFGALPQGGLAVRDASFDVGVVEDLNSAGPAQTIVRRLRRALTPEGTALVTIPNPGARLRLLPADVLEEGALDYYELYDTLRGEFTHVTMVGQAPFVGYAVVDFSVASPEPSLDTSGVPGGAEEPEWFIAVASDAQLRLDAFAVVQLPLAQTLPAKSSATDSSREKLDALRQAVAERDRWITELEARAAVADERADEALAELESEREARTTSNSALTDERELTLASAREALSRERETLRRQAEKAQQTLEQKSGGLLRAEQELKAARQELTSRRAELLARDAELNSLREQLASAQQELAVTRQQLGEAQAASRQMQPDDATEEFTRLEAALQERGTEVRRLSRDLTTLERLGRELLNGLSEVAANGEQGASSQLSAQLDRLAADDARRQADLEAARWTIRTLEGQLAESNRDALSADLEAAQAELQHKATLIAQLKSRSGLI